MTRSLASSTNLSFELLQAYRKLGIPVSAHLDLTWKCPLRCRHCYIENRNQDELTLNQWQQVLHQLRDLNVLQILFSGGEIFARRDTGQILRYAAQLKFAIRIKTSGFVYDESLLDLLAEVVPLRVDVSIYSDLPELHDTVTRVQGSFSRSVKFILELQERGVNVLAGVTLARPWYRSPKAIKSGLSRMGIKNVMFSPQLYDTVCDFGRIDTLRLTDNQEKEAWAELLSLENPSQPKPRSSTDLVCGAATLELYIAPNGDIKPCVMMPTVAGNVKSSSIEVIWFHSKVMNRFREFTWGKLPKCMECELNRFCGYCPAEALAHTGCELQPPPWFCKLASTVKSAFDSLA